MMREKECAGLMILVSFVGATDHPSYIPPWFGSFWVACWRVRIQNSTPDTTEQERGAGTEFGTEKRCFELQCHAVYEGQLVLPIWH